MIQKEVMAMSDEQLRVKAAELMGVGIEYFCYDDPNSVLPCLYSEEDVSDCTYLSEGKRADGCKSRFAGDLPDYPNDIAAAWELVDFAKTKGYSCVIYGPGGLTDECLGGGAMWEVQFQKGCWCDEDGVWHTGKDKDLCSRAITCAFILVMTEEDK